VICLVNRIPKTNKRKSVVIESHRKSDILARGEDPKTFLEQRIQALKDEAKTIAQGKNYTIDFNLPLELTDSGEKKISDDSKNLGCLVYSKLYHQLELDELINNRRRYTDCQFNMNVVIQHLLYSRLLWPASKLNTWEHKDRFFGDTDYSLADVYRSMDYLLKWRTDILTHLDSKIKEKYGRKDTIVFYDVTNYYFEHDKEDEKLIFVKTEDGKRIPYEGLCANGVSKEHRTEPIIQMGLFMDEKGLPITYELFRGNTNDNETLHEAMDRSIIDFQDSRKIVVADKGMMSAYNILKIRAAKNGYVISQSIRKSDEDTKKFALSEEGWTNTSDSNGEILYRVKERIIPRSVKVKGDIDTSVHSGTYNERQVFIWSKKYQERAAHDRQKALDNARKIVGRKSKDFKDSTYGKNKYLKKKPLKDGNILEVNGYEYDLDEDRIIEEELYDGYYMICTNVVGEEKDKINKRKSNDYSYYKDSEGFLVLNHEVPATEIVNIYGGLWKIEETFKVTKTGMLNLRPVFHSRQDRIRAHFLICFISLVLERLLEFNMQWKYSAASIQESLSSFNAVQLPNSNAYLLPYFDLVTSTALDTHNINCKKKFMTQLDIRKLFGATKKDD